MSGTESPAPDQSATFNISNDEVVRRLRAKGQPIRLFGEADSDRRLRLRALELLEEKEHERHGGQNDFKKALEDVEINELEAKAKGKEKTKERKRVIHRHPHQQMNLKAVRVTRKGVLVQLRVRGGM